MSFSKDHPEDRKPDGFQETFNTIMKSVFTDLKTTAHDNLPEAIEWLKSVVLYNVPHGKQIRGRLVAEVYRELVTRPCEEKLKQARVLGWCVEVLQASLLVADDIMDNGVTRRGQLCWYRVNNQGNIALNDAFLLEHVAHQIINVHFGDSGLYPDILKLFLGTTFKTLLGQSLDTRMGKGRNFDDFTEAAYKLIVIYKTSYYSFYLPIGMAMLLAGISQDSSENRTIWKQMEEVALKVGALYQIQDDYMDCFADYRTLGKIGTDIEEGKCTWLFVTAKEMCSGDEFMHLNANYGCKDPKKVKAVKAFYSKMGLEGIYGECKSKMYDSLRAHVNKIDHPGMKLVLNSLVEIIMKRNY